MKKKFKINENVSLLKVGQKDEHVIFLYKLLKSRNSRVSISHNKIPSLREHTNFLFNNPYRCWYVIEVSKKLVGSVYITKLNEIAVHFLSYNTKIYKTILLFIIKNIKPLKAIPSFRSKYFLINISEKNIKQANILKKIGGKKNSRNLRVF